MPIFMGREVRCIVGEIQYTYVRVLRADGSQGYDRVPLDQAASYPNRVVEELVSMPNHAPQFKNGEVPGSGSVVVDSLMAKTMAAEARRELRDALEAQAEAERINTRLGRSPKPEPVQSPTRPFGRVVEP
jgi:hypothetical protein